LGRLLSTCPLDPKLAVGDMDGFAVRVVIVFATVAPIVVNAVPFAVPFVQFVVAFVQFVVQLVPFVVVVPLFVQFVPFVDVAIVVIDPFVRVVAIIEHQLFIHVQVMQYMVHLNKHHLQFSFF
jgi:hypothetical protein